MGREIMMRSPVTFIREWKREENTAKKLQTASTELVKTVGLGL